MLASRYFSRTVPVLTQRFYASHSYEIKTTFAPDGTRTSVLENGVKIVQIPKEDTSVALGLFVNVGSVNETHQTHGSSHYLRRFLYKGTNKTSGLRITRLIENLTSQFDAVNGRESLAYTATTHPGHVRDVAEILADILRPRLAEWEFREVKALVQEDVEQRKSNLVATLGDKIRHIAFKGVGLGRAPVIPEYNINLIYPEQLSEWVASNVVGERITLVVAGNTPYEDEGLIKSLAAIFAAFPAQSPATAPVIASNYAGGELLEAGGPTNIYVEAYKGAASGTKEHAAQLVLANILGDAAGEYLPGNNVTSRFAKQFAGDEFDLVSSFNTNDSQTLFGVRAVGSAPTRVLAEKVHSQLANLASAKVTDEELNRSRNTLKNKVKLFRDSRHGNLVGALKWRNYDFDAALDELTPQSLQQAASKILSTPRTTVVKGDLSDLPSFK